MDKRLRACSLQGKRYYFHRWFEEGGQLDDGGTIDIGAILEDEEGNIIKAWSITEITFEEPLIKGGR
jgi:hypothetical protein